MIYAVAFDGHGVVYSRPREVIDVLREFLKSKELKLDYEKVKRGYLSLQKKAFVGEIGYKQMVHDFCEIFSITFLEGEVEKVIQKSSAAIKIEPDLKEVLKQLHKWGIKIGMITNSVHSAAVKREWLNTQGIGKFFDLILSSIEEKVRKPDPEIFRRFAFKISLSPEEVIFVGHDEVEMLGAKSAGMLTASFHCRTAEADFNLRTLKDLLSLPIWCTSRKQL